MKHLLTLTLGLIVCVSSAFGQEQGQDRNGALLNGCRKLPAINPNEDFLTNFNNSCYALPLPLSQGNSHAGDLNARYGLVYYKVQPGYELVLLGTFPNARFFSVTVYDGHQAQVGSFLDEQLPPLNASMVNPFSPNTAYLSNQQYGITIGLGGIETPTPAPGCSTADTTIDQNFLDGSLIHQGLSWNGYPGLPQGFPAHVTGANVGGQIIVRSYDDLISEPAPVVFARDLSTGCAVPLSQAGGIITVNPSVGNGWGDTSQTGAHEQFAYSIQKDQCFPQDPLNQVRWNRSPDYVPGDNSAAAYIGFNLSQTKVQSILSNNQFMLLRFQLPQMPDTPCTNGTCALTGSEQLRYRSISFENGKSTLASLMDSSFVTDPNGNVALVIGFGTKPPANVTAANYYTYFDLSSVNGYKNLNAVTMRDILPNPAFQCSNMNVPFFYSEYNPEMGYMGNYVPTVSFVTASQIPQVAVPVNRPNSCTAIVTQTPVVCAAP